MMAPLPSLFWGFMEAMQTILSKDAASSIPRACSEMINLTMHLIILLGSSENKVGLLLSA